ncbi:MAG: hypothetical protein KatS3mg050_0953 [Litorilinea sp.]|nr:MAG: hypothetical protein KatS3mg050_0953 [Litorilinea sp.]
MNEFFKCLIDSALYYSPLQTIATHHTRNALSVLAYHEISDPERFEAQLKFLVKRMKPISLDELIASLRRNRPLPSQAVLITFDDGDRSVYDLGLPIMKHYGLPGVVFVITSLINSQRPFWWKEVRWLIQHGADIQDFGFSNPDTLIRHLKKMPEHKRSEILCKLRQSAFTSMPPSQQLSDQELQELDRAGIHVGNHTHTHPFFEVCTDSEIVHELHEAHIRLESILGYTPKVFAFPYGSTHKCAFSVLEELGYELAFLFDHRKSVWPPLHPFGVSRLRVNSHDTLQRFGISVSGLHSFIHHNLGRK